MRHLTVAVGLCALACGPKPYVRDQAPLVCPEWRIEVDNGTLMDLDVIYQLIQYPSGTLSDRERFLGPVSPNSVRSFTTPSGGKPRVTLRMQNGVTYYRTGGSFSARTDVRVEVACQRPGQPAVSSRSTVATPSYRPTCARKRWSNGTLAGS
jgi:hypothetical protein